MQNRKRVIAIPFYIVTFVDCCREPRGEHCFWHQSGKGFGFCILQEYSCCWHLKVSLL
ncbi:unnamed protein product [Rhodiola kirilowii]